MNKAKTGSESGVCRFLLQCLSFRSFYIMATLFPLYLFLYTEQWPHKNIVLFLAMIVGIYWLKNVFGYLSAKSQSGGEKNSEELRRQTDGNSGKNGDVEEMDLIKELWKKTEELVQRTIEAISSWTFFLFLVSFIISWWLNTKNSEFDQYCFAISTTLFTIWLIEIVYSRRMDEINLQKMNLLLMQIFQRKTWLKDMDDNWREKVIGACYKATFGNELGEMYTKKTFGNQNHSKSYRKNFRYDVSIQRREKQQELFLVQKLQYKKMMKEGNDLANIVSIFEFKQDPFLVEGGDLVFFREELRSSALIFLIKNAPKISDKFMGCGMKESSEDISKECLNKIIQDLMDDSSESINREKIKRLWATKQDAIIGMFEKNRNKLLKDIIPVALLEYQLNYLNSETGQKERAESLPVEVEYIERENEVRGVRFKSELPTSGIKWTKEKDGYCSVYFSMECGYPIGGQHSFYWKFEEPIIAPQYQMQFPDATDMDNVQVVQYFSDNKQHVNKSGTLKSVWFTSTELFLPESGIYIHWPKEMENNLL